jgi:hypothetical protein
MKHSTVIKGEVAEADFLAYCVKKGWFIVQPVFSLLAYDYAIRRSKETGWESVQVKYVGFYDNAKIVGTRRAGNKAYKKGDFDLLYCYDEEVNKRWLIPYSVIANKTKLHINSAKYKEYEI